MADSEVKQEVDVTEEPPVVSGESVAPVEQNESGDTSAPVESGDTTENTDGGEEPSASENSDQKSAENGGKTAVTDQAAEEDDDDDDDDEDDEDDRKLYVGGLSWETQQNGLKEFMAQFGEVESCIIKKDNETGRSRGFGFVVFKEIAGLTKALDGRPHKVDGRKVDSKKAQPQPKKEIKLFVGGVKPETDEETIRAYFSRFGKIVKIDRPKDGGRDGKKFKAFCFIKFKKDSSVAKATKEHYHNLDDKEVECKEADPPQNAQGGARGRGNVGRGFPFMGGPGGYGFGSGGYGQGPFGYDMYGFNSPYGGMPYGGGGFGGGGGGLGYGPRMSGYRGGKMGRGGRQNKFKPY